MGEGESTRTAVEDVFALKGNKKLRIRGYGHDLHSHSAQELILNCQHTQMIAGKVDFET